MALSLDTFEPTRSMGWLGLVGLAGGALLLAAFLTAVPSRRGPPTWSV
jgi:hypothetical protein